MVIAEFGRPPCDAQAELVELIRANDWPVWLALPRVVPAIPGATTPAGDCGCGQGRA